jgi:hypothetical protein
MPLANAEPRQLVCGRAIVCRGYLRDDGLLDVEGQLVDTKGYDHNYGARPTVPAGQPIHEMWVRLTIDTGFTIHAVTAATDAAPYAMCRDVIPYLQRLVGLKILAGFKQEMRKRVGHIEGCTHIVALLEMMANNAVQTVAGSQRNKGQDAIHATYGARDRSKPALIDTCHTYAAHSPIVEKLWPQFFKPNN